MRTAGRTAGFVEGVHRFMLGFCKKTILANNLGLLVDTLFGLDHANLSVGGAWIAAAAYLMQVYYDFSGYSDMAIGLGRMFGFHFLENFRFPFIAKSVAGFWKRWHISMTSWFQDYLYIPLGAAGQDHATAVQHVHGLVLHRLCTVGLPMCSGVAASSSCWYRAFTGLGKGWRSIPSATLRHADGGVLHGDDPLRQPAHAWTMYGSLLGVNGGRCGTASPPLLCRSTVFSGGADLRPAGAGLHRGQAS